MKHRGEGWVAPQPAKSAEMGRVRTSGTKPEIELRRRLYREGLRYRVAHPVPGRPRRTIDVAFTRRRIAVFVDGCFWHGCPLHSQPPKTNALFWAAKLAENVARDADTTRHLEGAGWQVIRLWSHVPPDAAAAAVVAACAGSAR